MRVRVHAQGWAGTESVERVDDATVIVNCVLELDGHLIEAVTQVEAVFGAQEFLTLNARLLPSSFEVVTHTRESWPRLLDEAKRQRLET